jgi:HEAT repeat protein
MLIGCVVGFCLFGLVFSEQFAHAQLPNQQPAGKPETRLQAAIALGEKHDAAAVPALIALLQDLPAREAKPAEDWLRRLAGETAPTVTLNGDDANRSRCRAAWTAWWRDLDPTKLLQFFRTRTLNAAEAKKARNLIRQLGDDDFEVRQSATDQLMSWGTPVLPLLRHAASSGDPEVVERAQGCLKNLDQQDETLTPTTAARLLAFRPAPDAAQVLLDYVPNAGEEAAVHAVQDTLVALAAQAKTGAILTQGLADPEPLKRASAAVALCQAGVNLPPAVHALLKDQDQTVRLSVALALAARMERNAVPTLISLLEDLPLGQLWQVEEVLYTLAGEQAPRAPSARDPISRHRSQVAWAGWWRAHGSTVDMARLSAAQRLLGYTLVIAMSPNGSTGEVTEFGADGQPRWQIARLRFPIDARVLPGERILVSEYHGMRVTERDLQGKVLWQKNVTMPINCQRLPNGNTFIASRNLLLEVEPGGREVFSHSRSAHDVTSAAKLHDGQYVCLTSSGMCLRLDASGKEVRSIAVGQCPLGGLTVLPNDRLLVPLYSKQKVVEIDGSGKVVWDVAVQAPTSAQRLPNGNTLVSSIATRRIVEIDPLGKTVAEQSIEGRPWRVRRR